MKETNKNKTENKMDQNLNPQIKEQDQIDTIDSTKDEVITSIHYRQSVEKLKPIHLREANETVIVHLFEERCLNPKAVQKQIFLPLKNNNKGEWVTGLNDEEELELERLTGKSFSRYSDNLPEYYNQPIAKVIVDGADPLILNSNNLNDFIKIKFIKADHRIANSREELNLERYVDAKHYIFSEDHDKISTSKTVSKKKKVYLFLEKPIALQKAVIEVYLGRSLGSDVDQDLINQQFEIAIKEDINKLLEIIDRDLESIKIEAMVTEAVEKGVIQVSGDNYYFMDQLLGKKKVNVVKTLLNPDMSQTYLLISQRLKDNK